MEQTEQLYKSYLQRIANILMINGRFLDNQGLYTGEMGVALFFFRYSRFMQNELFSEYSFDLIEKIQNSIHNETPIEYRQGLAGIGSAIEYLVQCDYIQSDTDDVLEEIDARIFDLDKFPCLSMDDLLSIGYYALWRIAGNSVRKQTILQTVLPQMVWFMERKCQKLNFSCSMADCLKKLIETENTMPLQDIKAMMSSLRLDSNKYPYGLEENIYNRIMEQFKNKEHGIEKTIDFGLQNGLAGFGMALMTRLDGDDSWISLLLDDLIQKKDEPLPL